VGDTADGIPGIPGFGEKTAGALLHAFGHIEAIPPSPRAWPPDVRGADKLAANLAAERDAALLYRKLATLIEDVPLAESLEELEWKGVPRAEFEAWCTRMRAGDLAERVVRWQ
jgi:5'-3' exonuclease